MNPAEKVSSAQICHIGAADARSSGNTEIAREFEQGAAELDRSAATGPSATPTETAAEIAADREADAWDRANIGH